MLSKDSSADGLRATFHRAFSNLCGFFPMAHLSDHRDTTAAVSTDENEFVGGRVETAPARNSRERISRDCPKQVALSVKNLHAPGLFHAPGQENVSCGVPAGH